MSAFIITETPNGSAFIRRAWNCRSEAEFIDIANQIAIRSGESIETTEQALEYLDEKHAQSTRILTQSDFEEIDPSDWEKCVLEQAEILGWYTEEEI